MGLISRVSSRTYSKTGELRGMHSSACDNSTTTTSPLSATKSKTSNNSPIRRYNFSLRKHHSLSELENYFGAVSSIKPVYFSSSPSAIPLLSFHILLKSIPNTRMSAAKVRVHNTSTSSIDAVVEPLKSITLDKPVEVTCKETFLEDVKILKPIEGVTPPAAKDILPHAPKQKIVVGVTGVSCGGKSTVAKGLNNRLNKSEQNSTLLMQDDFYKPATELPINTITNFPEFDEPESVRMDLIKEAILDWLEKPVEVDEDAQILIVEGTMIFTDPEICSLCDLRYLVHVDFEVAKYRRSLRNYKIPDPPAIMARNIWPEYIKHREIFRQLKNKYNFMCKQINGTVPVEQTIAGILLDVKVNKHR